jgi:hypothetical protein
MKAKTEEDKRRLKAYKIAKSDMHAAELLNLPFATFTSWRRSRKLRPLASVGRPQRTPNN